MSAYPGGLGGQTTFDIQNLNYLISDRIADPDAKAVGILASRAEDAVRVENAPAEMRSKYHNDSAWWGDQGSTPHCTAFAAMHAMADGPITHRGHNPLVEPHAFYAEIQAIDRAEGRVYSEGATSLAMAKALAKRGYIGEYLWGYSLADFVAAIKVAPVLLGIDWHEGMDWPDRKAGIIRAFGQIRGGHEIVCNGADFSNGMARLKQSWGRQWGRNGHCYLPFEDLEALIADGGDVCLFRELKVAA